MLDHDKLIPFDELFPAIPERLNIRTRVMLFWSNLLDDLTILKWNIRDFFRKD